MIFEKKVIIGSVVSFIATAVGIVAVFFPDLLNLQKEKIQSFSSSISNKEEAKKLADFLDRMAKEKKIFNLDVLICFPSDTTVEGYGWLDKYLMASEDNEVKDTILTVVAPIEGIEDEDFERCFDEHGGYSGHICGAKTYYFPTKNYENTEWILDFSRTSYSGKNHCDNTKDNHMALAITGHFTNSKSKEYKAIQENVFELVSEQQLKLKNY